MHAHLDVTKKQRPTDNRWMASDTTTYVPLTRAIAVSGHRVSDALTALSIAEIRPSLTTKQLGDTVEEMRAAVDEAVALHRLFVAELEKHRAMETASAVTVRGLAARRAGTLKGTDAPGYKAVTHQLLEEVRRRRTLLDRPTMEVCSLVASLSLPPALIPVTPPQKSVSASVPTPTPTRTPARPSIQPQRQQPSVADVVKQRYKKRNRIPVAVAT